MDYINNKFRMNFSIGEKPNSHWERHYLFLYLIIFGTGLAWMIYFLIQSPGTPVQDEIGHYLISRNAWSYPQLMLDFWGRTVNTIVYMVPSLGGLFSTRLFSVFLAGVTVLITTGVAVQLEMRWYFFLIPLFLWFQPWFADLSYAVITQVPFSLCLILGIFFWLRRRNALAGLIFGLLPLIRHEGILVLGLWCLFMLVQMEWKAMFFSVLPFLIYQVIYYIVFEEIIATVYFNSSPTDFYGSGSWFHYVPYIFHSVGPIVTGFAILSIPTIIKLRNKSWIFLFYISYFAVHTIIYRFGLYASGGYGLFMLPLAPGIALAAGLGCEWVFGRLKNFLKLRAGNLEPILLSFSIGIIAILVIVMGTSISPRLANVEQIASQEAAEWLRSRDYKPENVISTHVWFYHYFDLPLLDGRLWLDQPPLEELSPGTIVVWDKHYSDRWNIFLSELENPANRWEELADFQEGAFILFQKQE